MSELFQALAVVTGLGLAWTAGHCAGMCGPLLLGLGVARCDPAAGRLRGGLAALGRLGAYQLGRALGYAGLGALAGWAGAGIATRLSGGEVVLGGLLAGACFLAALAHLGWLPWRRHAVDAAAPGLVARLGGVVHRRLGGIPGVGPAALGLALALLPCGIVWWSLGVAAATAHPLHGALVMVALVAITTPALAGVTLAPLLVPTPWRARFAAWSAAWMVPAAWTLSGVWLVVLTVQRSAAGGCCHPV